MRLWDEKKKVEWKKITLRKDAATGEGSERKDTDEI